MTLTTIASPIQNTLTRLKAWGLPALPVAPPFPVEEYATKEGKPKFTGKNPSYLDKDGIPQGVAHSRYRDVLPSQEDSERFFASSKVGIGTLGGWQNTIWIDLDAKQFQSLSECEDAAFTLAAKIEELAGTPYLERTRSGGYHIGIKVTTMPTFTNFALTEGGSHKGEALGKGRFCVLSPTPGYELISCPEALPEVESLESIGIYPTRGGAKQQKPKATPKPRKVSQSNGSIQLEELVSPTSKAIISGDGGEDRSASLTTLARELYGWENWCQDNGVTYSGEAQSVLEEVAAQMGVDSDRLERITQTIDQAGCSPAAWGKGDDEACWKRASKLDPSYKRSGKAYQANQSATSGILSELPQTKSGFPPADLIGEKLGEIWQDHFAWSAQHQTWMVYSLSKKGVWVPVDDIYIDCQIDAALKAEEIQGYNSQNFIKNIRSKLQREVYVREWSAPDFDFLPFEDGILNLTTNTLLDHSPSYRQLWALPRRYNGLTHSWDKIDGWLAEATGGDSHMKMRLLCFAAAVLRGRYDLHKFLHLLGPGGTGKSSYTTLLSHLVGAENTWIGNLDELGEKDAVIDLLGKRLAVFADQDPIHPKLKLSNFKSLTGGECISGREVYKKRASFRFNGMAVMTSNKPVFHSPGSWLVRRCITETFSIKPKNPRNLEREFAPELSGFTNYLLSIPLETIENVLQGFGGGNIQPTFWEAQIGSDSLSAWLNDMVIYDREASTQIGANKDEWAEGGYNPHTSSLFGSYHHYCKTTGLFGKSKNKFSPELLELCQQTLGWQVEKTKTNGNQVIKGLRLRLPADADFPTLDESLGSQSQGDLEPGRPSGRPQGDLRGDLKPIQGKTQGDQGDLNTLNFLQGEHSNEETPNHTSYVGEDNKNKLGGNTSPHVSLSQTEQGLQVSLNVSLESPQGLPEGEVSLKNEAQVRENEDSEVSPGLPESPHGLPTVSPEENVILQPGMKVTSSNRPGEIGELVQWREEWSEWVVTWEWGTDYQRSEHLNPYRTS